MCFCIRLSDVLLAQIGELNSLHAFNVVNTKHCIHHNLRNLEPHSKILTYYHQKSSRNEGMRFFLMLFTILYIITICCMFIIKLVLFYNMLCKIMKTTFSTYQVSHPPWTVRIKYQHWKASWILRYFEFFMS